MKESQQRRRAAKQVITGSLPMRKWKAVGDVEGTSEVALKTLIKV